MFEIEEVDADEYELLEAALAQAEQQYAARNSGGTAAAGPPPAHGPDAANTKRKLPSSLAAPSADGTGAAPTACKRKLPASLAGPSADGGSCPALVPPPQLPFLTFLGPVQYAYTAVEVDGLCEALLHSRIPCCGFDIEWRVTYQAGVAPRPVALVQLCLAALPHCHRVLLLHIARSGLTPHLRQLLCSKDILKCGVGAHGDALKMQRDFGFEMEGVMDLSEFANMRLCTDGTQPQKWSLAGLTERLLQCTLEKSQSLRCSDWEHFPLTAEQRKYAAADVFASLRVYEILEQMPVVWNPTTLLHAPQLLPAAEAGGDKGGSGGGGSGVIPAYAQVAPLQPAKLAVYQQHMAAGLSVQQIAAARHIQVDSAEGYLAEAITAGYAYSWGRLGVPGAALSRVAEVAGQLLGRSLACQLPEPAEQQQQADSSGAPQPLACSNGAHANRAAGSGGGSCNPGKPCAGSQRQQQQQQQQEEGAAAGGGGRPVDVLQELLNTGAKMRELKEQHWEDIPYGQLRLALAHLGRCNPGPWT